MERVGSVVWAADNFNLFYTVEDEEQKRQYQLWRHMRGTPYSGDELVYQDDDERFNVGAGRTRDGKYMVMESASHTTTECWVLPAGDPDGEFTVICPREDEHEYSVDHRNGLWFIRTNDRGRNFRLVTRACDSPHRENWVERIPHRDDVMLEDVDLFNRFFVACEREDGLPRLRLWRFNGDTAEAENIGEIAFPEPAYSAHPHINRIFDTRKFRYCVPVAGDAEFGIRIRLWHRRIHAVEAGGGSRRLRPHPLRQRADPRHCGGRRRGSGLDRVSQATSASAGKNPLYVYGYGSYGYSLPLGFNSNRLSLLDRGVVMAYAHIRGGGDLGKPWHDAGKMLVKRNTFTDFIAAVEHLTPAATAIRRAWPLRAARPAGC